jgi:hypothetical protein
VTREELLEDRLKRTIAALKGLDELPSFFWSTAIAAICLDIRGTLDQKPDRPHRWISYHQAYCAGCGRGDDICIECKAVRGSCPACVPEGPEPQASCPGAPKLCVVKP